MRFFSILVLAMLSLSVSAQEYLMTTPVGFGSAATGGNTTIARVSDASSFEKALTGTAGTIIVTGNITFTKQISAQVSNKTILGMTGVTLTNTNQTASGSGILELKDGSRNVIIRNLKFKGPGSKDVEGNDLLFNRGTNVWVDHCEFDGGVDGNFDNSNDADNVTISWCKFSYPNSGNHNFSNLVSGDTDIYPADGRFSVTFMYCWWADRVVERMPRARNAQLHLMNNYVTSADAKEIIGLGGGEKGTTCYAEGCDFGSKGTVLEDGKDSGTQQITIVNCSKGNTTVGGGTPRPNNVPASMVLPFADVKNVVGNTTCGAGATLIIDNNGNISSPCGNEPQDAEITLTSAAATANQTLTVNNAITNITYDYTGTYKNIVWTGGTPTGITVNTDTAGKITISDTPTVAGTYSYTINIDGLNEGAPANAKGTITVNGAVATPGNVQVIPGTDNLQFSWDPVADATGYEVELCSGSGDGGGDTGGGTEVFMTATANANPQTLNTGDISSAQFTSNSGFCTTDAGTVTRRSGSVNNPSLTLVNTDNVTKLVIGVKSSGSAARKLVSYSINGGAAITTGITKADLAVGGACGEFEITGLSLKKGDVIAFATEGNQNIQISYFIATTGGSDGGGTPTCQTYPAGNNTSLTINDLEPDTEYSYSVRAL
ncbi:MAG: hypothetical protein LBR75_05950, partial [Prevotellaceae bacterium]|nr:hypothetical protein [Prevotellaceae bacterium]